MDVNSKTYQASRGLFGIAELLVINHLYYLQYYHQIYAIPKRNTDMHFGCTEELRFVIS